MEIRSNAEGLERFWGVSPSAPQATPDSQQRQHGRRRRFDGDQATLSSRQRGVAVAAEDGRADGEGCRDSGCAGRGHLQVPAAAVASKVMDAMLGGIALDRGM